MRIINLIVVHCSATREDCTLSPEDLDRLHRRRGFNGTGYHYYIRKAMKVVWTAGDARQIPGLRHNGLRSGNSLGNYRRNSLAAGYADTGIFHRT